MKKWITEVTTIDVVTNEIKTWMCDTIEAPTRELAQEWCEKNGKGYLTVTGECVVEIPCKKNSLDPDFSKAIDYENMQSN